MKPIVFYHANCADGFGAAYAAWTKLGPDAEYVPMHYGDVNHYTDLTTAHDDIADRPAIYILDFSFPRQVMDWLLDNARSVIWLDHHKTAFEMWDAVAWMEQPNGLHQALGVPITNHIRLDNNKSGAMLAWEWFQPDAEPPYLIKLIDDRDRWVFQYGDDSRAMHAALQLAKPWTFEVWDSLTSISATLAAIREGQTALKVYQEQVRQSATKAGTVRIVPAVIESALSYKAPWLWSNDNQCYVSGLAVNTPNNISEVGHELANRSGTFGLVWYYDHPDGVANCSLRSNDAYDVSVIAKAFGGGGHRNAAGFRVPVSTLMSWL